MVLWLGEASGVPKATVAKAKQSALSAKPSLPALSAAIRGIIPWKIIEDRLDRGGMHGHKSRARRGASKRTTGTRKLRALGHSPVQKAWRDDRQKANEIMKETFPRQRDFDLVLTQLSESIDQAKSVAPRAWAVTLFPDGFRLNVGQVEVLTAFHDEVRLLVQGANQSIDRKFLRKSPYKVSGDNYIFGGSTEQFRRYRHTLLAAHYDFIHAAGTTKSGNPRAGTPHRASHSSGLADLAKDLVPTIIEERRTIHWVESDELDNLGHGVQFLHDELQREKPEQLRSQYPVAFLEGFNWRGGGSATVRLLGSHPSFITADHWPEIIESVRKAVLAFLSNESEDNWQFRHGPVYVLANA